MSLARALATIIDIGVDVAAARQVVRDGLIEALTTMENMVGNEGQQSIFDSYVSPAFIENIGPIDDGWIDVDIGEYMDFMGEIVGVGNLIMQEAYELAQEILSELEEYLEEAGEE